MLAVRQSAEEGIAEAQVQADDAIAATVKENVAEDVPDDVVPSPPSHDIPSPPQEHSSPPQQPQKNDNAAQKLDFYQAASKAQEGRMIDDMDKDKGIELVKDADVAETEGRHPSILAAAPTVVAAYTRRRKGVIIREPKEELSSKTPAETPKVKDKGKGILVETPKPMKKMDQIELDAEYAKKLHEEINKDHEEFNKDIDWDAAMDHVNQKSKNPQYIKRYQGIKKRPQTESEARKNMMIYLKNIVGYKMDFFKGMTGNGGRRSGDHKSINETPSQKAVKRQKLSEEAQEAEDLRKRLEVVDDEDDDVFIEATPLARKVPVVDYQTVLINNKPRFKIIRADETHQFYISFTTLLKNFDREDLENLWEIVKKRFSTSKPTNFFDEYLLLTLKTMFEKLDG
nr:hypothetical protein [Tanacetum cinerariifolium]